jgi:hypothetical protein
VVRTSPGSCSTTTYLPVLVLQSARADELVELPHAQQRGCGIGVGWCSQAGFPETRRRRRVPHQRRKATIPQGHPTWPCEVGVGFYHTSPRAPSRHQPVAEKEGPGRWHSWRGGAGHHVRRRARGLTGATSGGGGGVEAPSEAGARAPIGGTVAGQGMVGDGGQDSAAVLRRVLRRPWVA